MKKWVERELRELRVIVLKNINVEEEQREMV